MDKTGKLRLIPVHQVYTMNKGFIKKSGLNITHDLDTKIDTRAC